MDQFAHISLSLCSDACCGVLVRQTMARLIDVCEGDLPHSTEPVCRLLRWVLEVWILYHDLMRRVGLDKLLTVGKQTSTPFTLNPKHDIPYFLG